MRRITAAGPPANRPPHIGFALAAPAGLRWSGGLHWSPGRGSAVLRGVAMSLLLVLAAAASPAAAPETGVTLGHFTPAAAPRPAPEVAFTDIEGKPAGLADLRGKPVVVNFWATWCQPCLREMPSLEALQEKLGDKLTIAAVSQDRGGEKAVVPFLPSLGSTRQKSISIQRARPVRRSAYADCRPASCSTLKDAKSGGSKARLTGIPRKCWP